LQLYFDKKEIVMRMAPFKGKAYMQHGLHGYDEECRVAKCSQCGKEVAPKKTWKMAGRPDKAGKRTELTIGLCECCGKTFRTVVSKQKI
jgi:hypothetical protein